MKCLPVYSKYSKRTSRVHSEQTESQSTRPRLILVQMETDAQRLCQTLIAMMKGNARVQSPQNQVKNQKNNQNVGERGSFQPEALAIHKCIPQQPLQLLSRAVAVQSEGVEAGPCDRIPGAVVSEARKPKRQAGGAHRGNPVTTSHKRENLPLDLWRGILEEVPEPFHHCNCLGSLRGPIIVGSHGP